MATTHKFTPTSIFVTVLVFAMVLSPTTISTVNATRVLLQQVNRPPICPACVCCEPAPAGSCCRCCATPIQTSSQSGSP
ncbi:uncharacterized protein LOC111456398 [Cucurbita moschata]|uniref:Uncharacterized protein LOC111456398 n=1 Tax=Cucurbita moschata TaxID=3662 RepID=A0A6J1GR88_CUCMO|nr:uncharacterized protein LOC111456398 [Cucurbita moschata]